MTHWVVEAKFPSLNCETIAMNQHAGKAQEIFFAAIEKYKPNQWHTYLDDACDGDVALRARVDEMLQAHAEMGSVDIEVESTDDVPERTESPGTKIGRYKLLQQIC